MSSTLKSARTASSQRKRNPSKSSPSKVDESDPAVWKLQALLQHLPDPCPKLETIRTVGEGTFSKVFLCKDGERKIAIKHLVPTASPDRILMEVECLKKAEGKENVLPLLFVHRHLGDVVLAMPFIECSKFSEIIRTMDHVEARMYMRNLLRALAHVHKLGIIHRDIKPANFLYDRKNKIFRLVDFGLAQRMGETVKSPTFKMRTPRCKRKLTSSDLANSMDTPPSASQSGKKRKVTHPQEERGANRKVLSEILADDKVVTPVKNETPTKTNSKPDQELYDRRGAIMSARKRTRASTRNQKTNANLSDDCVDPDEDEQQQQEQDQSEVPKTPNKNLESIKVTPEVRRSPRKHASSVSKRTSTPGFSKLTISGSAIVNDRSNIKRQPSFTILDPASGVPSDGTPRLQASLTSRHSTTALMLHNLQFPLSPATNFIPSKSLQFLNNPSPVPLLINEQHNSTFPTFAKFVAPTVRKAQCNCYGKSRVCSKCLSRKSQRAARAGTPGFRPPEVLMKFEHQTTAVDMWAAGVILLCILSRTYPFFRAPDDLTALAELLALFGTKALEESANQYGKRLICSEQVPGHDLQLLCQKLAERKDSKNPEPTSTQCLASDQAADLLKQILSLSSHERLTAEAALQHPFFED